MLVINLNSWEGKNLKNWSIIKNLIWGLIEYGKIAKLSQHSSIINLKASKIERSISVKLLIIISLVE